MKLQKILCMYKAICHNFHMSFIEMIDSPDSSKNRARYVMNQQDMVCISLANIRICMIYAFSLSFQSVLDKRCIPAPWFELFMP